MRCARVQANAPVWKILEKGDLSPLSSPALGALSSSPEQTTFNLRDRDRSDGNLSIPSPGDPMRLSTGTSTSSNDYDQLSR